ncbi:MAG: hypothetical protein ACI9NT_002638 [Bacteroidia bacterium]|jgi:hypothetical protein
MIKAVRRFSLIGLMLALMACLTACDSSGEPDVIGGPLAMRRLTPEQYRYAIEDAFGPKVEVAGRFEPDSRRDGLNALGTALVAVTPSGFEQYEAIAHNTVQQITSEALRSGILPCEPSNPSAPDDACTQKTLEVFGHKLLRRPLTAADYNSRVTAAAAVAAEQGDFYAGLRLALVSLMVTPQFLFRIEEAEPAPSPEHPGRLKLTEQTLASRISYFLWNRGPDDELLAAVEAGTLSEPQELTRQVERMLASDHLADGVRAFFDDLFLFDQFDELGKDVARYPLFSNRMAMDAREQTLRFVIQQLVERRADYRTLYTSRELPMTRSLGPVYGVPVRAANGWEDASIPDSQPRAGLLSHASFNMLFAHPGRSSATLRGVFMREALLCQTIPEAPADVDFTQFSNDQQAVYKTARERLEVHSTQASCRKCHKLTDPIGLAMENFDGIGKFRTLENGVAIQTSGAFDGADFSGPEGLGEAFADSPLINACLVQNMYRYAVGRKQTNPERQLLRYLENQFAQHNYQVPALMREIVLSQAFRTASQSAAEHTAKAKYGVAAENKARENAAVKVPPNGSEAS